LLMAVLYPALTVAVAYALLGKTKQDQLNHEQTVAQVHWLQMHSSLLIVLLVSYAVMHFALLRWARAFLHSKVTLRPLLLLLRFSFGTASSDPVALGSFYVALTTLIVTGIALLVQ